MKDKAKDTINRALEKFKNAARGAQDPRHGISVARASLPEAAIQPAIRWLETAAPKGVKITGPSFPQAFTEVHRFAPFAPLSARKEFLWAANRVLVHAENIAAFSRFRQIASKQVFRSQLPEAIATLKKADEEVGVSLWGMKLRIALEQNAGGFEAQKRYTLSLMDPKIDQYVQYIAHYVSVRNEAALSPGSFKSMFERHRAMHSLPSTLEEYFTFHLIPRLSVDADTAAGILSIEDAGTVIDLFETFVSLSSQLYATDIDTFREVVFPAVDLLASRIKDARLVSLRAASRGSWHEIALPTVDQAPLHSFLRGDYRRALEESRATLEAGVDRWEMLDLLARCSAILGEKNDTNDRPMWIQLAEYMNHLLTRDDQFGEAAVELARLGLNLEGLLWSDYIFGFLQDELGDYAPHQSAHFATGGFLPPLSVHPPYALGSKSIGLDYFMLNRHTYGSALAVDYVGKLIGPTQEFELPDELSPEVRTLAEAEYCLLHQPERAIPISRRLAETSCIYFRIRAIRVAVAAMLKLHRLADCLRYISDIYLDKSELWTILSVSTLVALITPELRKALRSDASLAIVYDIYGQHVRQDLMRKLRVVYQEFLAAHEVSRPSELKAAALGTEEKKLIYFLRHICIPPIMASSPAVNGSTEVVAERLAVCQLLVDLDPERARDYQAEIKDITTNQAVERGMQEVAQSKIHVDLDGVRKAAEKNLRERFNRYRTFLDSDVEDLLEGVMSALRKARAGDSPAVVTLRLPKGGASDILDSLVRDLRDEFVSNTQYGLDGYLSQRIRHGTLQGHLRSPLEAANLITQQEAVSSRYRPNEYWAERLITANEKPKTSVALRLAGFSADFDALVAKVRTEWIQIRRADTDTGLFDFRIASTFLSVLSTTLPRDCTFQTFVDATLGLLMKQLEENLERVRDRIQIELKDEVNALLRCLREDLQEITRGIDDSDLGGTIVTVQTHMQRAVDRMAEWFCLPTQTSDYPFPLSLAVQVAAETANRFHQRFALDLRCDAEADPSYPLAVWINFVDVFLILMENVVKHSGLRNGSTVAVKIWEEAGLINIRVSSQTSRDARTSEAEERVARIRYEIERGDYKKLAPKEGRSGFHKIQKIVGHDFQTLDHMNFGFASNDEFVVTIRMQKAIVTCVS